jgi:hypothetical protein
MQLQVLTLVIPDQEILRICEEVLAAHQGLLGQNCTWFLADNDQTSCPWAELRANPVFNLILERKSSVLRYFEFTFNAPGAPGNGFIRFERQNQGGFQVTLGLGDDLSRSDSNRRTAILISFRIQVEPFERDNLLEGISPLVGNAYEQMRQATSRLMELNSQITRDNEQYRKRLESDYDLAKTKLETEQHNRREALDAEYAAKLEALESRESELAAHRKALDDRDNTHARRQKQEDLISKLERYQTSFKLTADTDNKRRPIHAAFSFGLLLLAVLIGVNTWYALQPLQQGIPFWWPPVRAVAYGGALVFLLIYYIRWQGSWAQIHADEEFSLKRLELDGIRAGWLVEVLLEWQREGKSEIPAELVQRLGANLFTGSTSGRNPSPTHPAEDILASVLGAAASVDIDLPRGTAKFDRKALDRAKGTA